MIDQPGDRDVQGSSGRRPVDAASETVMRLLTGIAGGSRSAFLALYDELSPLVHGIATRLGQDATEANEITKETFVLMWRHAVRFSSREPDVCILATAVGRRLCRPEPADGAGDAQPGVPG